MSLFLFVLACFVAVGIAGFALSAWAIEFFFPEEDELYDPPRPDEDLTDLLLGGALDDREVSAPILGCSRREPAPWPKLPWEELPAGAADAQPPPPQEPVR